MVDFSLERELRDSLALLTPAQRRQLLEHARSLGEVPGRGAPPASLLRFVGRIPAEDLESIARAVEEGCERVDAGDS